MCPHRPLTTTPCTTDPEVRVCRETDETQWDAFVARHPDSTHSHLVGWKGVLERAYGHESHYLVAESGGSLVGVLPLFLMRTLPFRKHLVSLPFLGGGGMLAESEQVEEALLGAALALARRLGVSRLELRQQSPLQCASKLGMPAEAQTHKARLILSLPDSPEKLLESFKAKLRSQIRRPQKEGMEARIGGSELLQEFYRVFSRNMRDLGSPVHSRKLFEQIFSCFQDRIRVVLVSQGGVSCAAAVLLEFRDTLETPWASSLKQFNRLAPNMLLYWTALEHGCRTGFRRFDFGRSTIDDGTFAFKKQWGAVPHPLHWYCIDSKGSGRPSSTPLSRKSSSRRALARAWGMLPLGVANRIGPVLRRRISL